MESDKRSDEQLMAQVARTCDDACVRELFSRYHSRSLGLVTVWASGVVDAEDVVQDAFIQVIRHRRRYDSERAFRPWFHRILRNVCVDAIRRATRHDRRADFWSKGATCTSPPVSLRHEVFDLLDSLSPEDREVLVLRVVEGRSFREIGDVLSCGEEAAKKRAQRALKRLRAQEKKADVSASAALPGGASTTRFSTGTGRFAERAPGLGAPESPSGLFTSGAATQ